MMIAEINFCIMKHLDSLVRMEKHCFPSLPWSMEMIRRDLKEGPVHYVGAFSKGFLVGYGVFRMEKEQTLLLRLGVHQDYRRQGIASQLLASGEVLAEESRSSKLVLTVHQENLAARRLYENAGYTCQGFSQKTYQDTGEYGLVYARDVSFLTETQEFPPEEEKDLSSN